MPPRRGPTSAQFAQSIGPRPKNPLYGSARLPLLDVFTTVGMLGFDKRARAEAISLLRLKPQDRVLDVACGTGRSLLPLACAVGEGGIVVGIDRSPALIERAARRVAGSGNIELISSDWLEMNVVSTVDAAICVLGLSVIEQWEMALDRMLCAVRPGGRIAVVDSLVDPDQASSLNAYIRFGSWLAQADPKRQILTATEARVTDTTSYRLPMGVHLVAGTRA
jgi:ubiquinone/menaquinone biosynthesis C-methylase UbiE